MYIFTKNFILHFLILFEIALISIFIYYFDFSVGDISIISKGLIFDIFVLEFIVLFLLIQFLWGKHPVLTFLLSILFLVFISISSTQLISYAISSDFLSQTALNNVEFIGFILTGKNITTVLIILLILIIIPASIAYLSRHVHLVSPRISIFFIGLAMLLMLELNYIPTKYTLEKEKIFAQNNLHHTAPLTAFIKLFAPKEKVKSNFTTEDIKLLNHAGFSFNPNATYPLMKEETYSSKKEFHSTIEKPNIIILFSEGLSARTLSMYNDKFKDLTPHLQAFSEHPKTMVATDYYNHTAATYKGLHGQLCSFFPSLGGRQWNHSIPNSENIDYQCLADILNLHQYDTTYLNVHLKDVSGNDELALSLGFKNVISAEELQEKYIKDQKLYREHELTDHQAYSALTNYLKKSHSDSPFFISMYTAETHAWCDTSEDGTIYKEGKDEVLNTLHNLDDAFGKFWDYFSHSKYADNTIILFTADHAHYFDDAYTALMKEKKEKYRKIFIDKIPLLIYAPTHSLPQRLQTNQSTSLDLAPSLMHLLNIKEQPNAFLGDTIFGRETNPEHIAIAAYDSNIYVLDKNQIHHNKFTSLRGKKFFDVLAKFFSYTAQLEKNNSIFNVD